MALTIAAAFTQSNGDSPATGLTLADIDLYLTRQNKTTGATTVIWDGTQNPTAEIDNTGAYARLYTSEDFETYNYFARAQYTGVSTLDQDTVQGSAGAVDVENIDSNTLDTLVDLTWDEVLTGATHNVPTSSGRRLRGIQEFQGYELGAIWIDTVNGTAGTIDYENGTVENPVSTLADANTLAASLGISRFMIAPGSSLTFVASQDGQSFMGHSWTLALGGQSISASFFEGANISGVATGATEPNFSDCHFSNVTMPPFHAWQCGLEGTITIGTAGNFFLDMCHSGIAGTSTPIFDFGALLNSSDVSLRNWSGGIEVQNMGAGTGSYNMSLEGNGQLIINANCSATSTIAIRGHFTVTDNAGGAVTLSDNARFDVDAVADGVWDEVISKSVHNDPSSAGKYLRQTGVAFIWEGTAQGPGTGTNQIQLDTGASATDGAYDPSAVSIIDGTGAGQSRLILQYEGATRTATVDRDWKVNPDATSEFIITPHPGRNHVNEGLAQGGTASTITLNALASSVDNVYIGQRVFISSGTGADQVGRITAYNGTTKVATVAQTWDITPDTTSGYSIQPDAPNMFQGYEAAAIWIDTVNGTAGTVAYENGTAENPVSTLADATALATTLGFAKFIVAAGSSITLAQAYNGFTFGSSGANGWTLALGGQSISNATIIGATVSGVCSGASSPTFISCTMGAVTIPASRVVGCAIASTQTMTGTGDFFYDACYSGIAGTSTWALVFSASANLNLRHYSGGIHIQSMAATNNMSLEGNGQIIINANCTGGTVAIRGHFTVTDNASGAVTLSDDARFDIHQMFERIMQNAETYEQYMNDIRATVAGAAVADDADTPTSIAYKQPDGSTTQLTHGLSGVNRTES